MSSLSIKEYLNRFRGFRKAYEAERIELVLRAADDAVALMKIRVINDRINAEGSVFGIYAEQTIKRKGSRNSDTGDKRINFSDTNRMWSGTGGPGSGVKAVVVSSDAGSIRIVVQPENDQNRLEVLGHLEDRFGLIVAWNQEEKDLIVDIYEQQIRDLLNRFGL